MNLISPPVVDFTLFNVLITPRLNALLAWGFALFGLVGGGCCRTKKAAATLPHYVAPVLLLVGGGVLDVGGVGLLLLLVLALGRIGWAGLLLRSAVWSANVVRPVVRRGVTLIHLFVTLNNK